MGSKSLQVSTDSFNDINLGKKICLENGSSSKVMNPLKNPSRCQVKGCNVDLSGAKAYYCKHRVCGMHSKSPMVIVGGLEQRFCQQCSRFHQLSEFDQGKRSCRRRLAGHNERRRKPHSASLSSPTGLPSPPYHAVDNMSSRLRGFFMNFAYPQLSARDPLIMKQWQGSTNLSVREGPIFDSSHAFSLLSDRNRALIAAAANSSCVSPNDSFGSWGFDATNVLEPMWMQNELAVDLRGERQRVKLDDDGNEPLL